MVKLGIITIMPFKMRCYFILDDGRYGLCEIKLGKEEAINKAKNF